MSEIPTCAHGRPAPWCQTCKGLIEVPADFRARYLAALAAARQAKANPAEEEAERDH